MSKKVLLAIFTTLISFSLVADTPEQANMTVFFNILDEGYTGYMDFGFANGANAESTIETIDAEVSANWEESVDNIYAYWDVVSTESFSLELYTEPLISENGHMLDWTISWNSENNDEVYIGGDKYGVSNSTVIHTRNTPTGASLEDKGHTKLEIDIPVDESLPSGKYTGRIVMRLESI